MPARNTFRDLIDGLIACDQQPSDECLTEVRKTLEHKVMRMKRNGRISQWIFAAGMVVMALGFAVVMASDDGHQGVAWLARTGFGVLIVGTIVIVIAAIGLLRFRGFGYVWARHDLHDAAILELSLQIQRLSQRMDASDKSNSSASGSTC